MPNEQFWRERFQKLGVHSVGPGNTNDETQLEEHRQYFVKAIANWLSVLKGPVLDFGCGVGRWVNDLPRPYIGLDLLPEHLEICRTKYIGQPDIDFQNSLQLDNLPDKKFHAIFTCTVLQHIVEKDLREHVLREFKRTLSEDGMLLSIEWAENQREFDWCTAVRQKELAQWFHVKKAGEVVESGRKSNIWVCKPRTSLFS